MSQPGQCGIINFKEFSIETPIDIESAVEGFGGEDTIFYMMVDKLESMTLNKIMKDLVPAYENKDYKEIKMLAHSLKGASAYIGASRLHYACFFIQAHFVNNEF